MPRPRRENRV